MGKLRKKGTTLLKFIFSALLLYLVFSQIPLRSVWEVLSQCSLLLLLPALLFFMLSKWVAALRLNRYFHQINTPLTHNANLRLYLLGMFYNLFLPGGIGGDAYKGYLLNKTFDSPTKKLVAVLLLDRISGMYLLFLYSGALLLFLAPEWLDGYQIWTVLLLVSSLGIYWVVHNKFFSYLQVVFWGSLGFSAVVQFSQLICVYFIFAALGLEEGLPIYLFVFLVSSIVAVLPFTIGGVGSRELVFYYGALWLELREDTAIAISLVFFLITALCSLLGIYYHFKKPVLSLTTEAEKKF
ncbi:lysylphosphatidylglycerol synthase transmembrane domain-containing protein [Robiginitalea sp. IMCC43444]|uniref:lysylphosphatidylglycerol synthase transmembrane domain-containing protein n=1 Tax=Robiginitalea sp. IMCC43444 TaxID=3459121 RepID=UPI004041ABF0